MSMHILGLSVFMYLFILPCQLHMVQQTYFIVSYILTNLLEPFSGTEEEPVNKIDSININIRSIPVFSKVNKTRMFRRAIQSLLIA